MEKALGATKGAVNLFSIINDTAKAVTLVMDQKLLGDYEYVGFHPMVNTATTAIDASAIKKVIELSGHEPMILDFTTLGGGEAVKPAGAQGADKPKQEPKQKPK